MQKEYKIVELRTGGNVIDVTATAKADGGLTIFDLSFGAAADAFFGEGQDVEVWLKLKSDSVKMLADHFFDSPVENPADEVGQFLASHYKNDCQALSKIQSLLDELEIEYEKSLWI